MEKYNFTTSNSYTIKEKEKIFNNINKIIKYREMNFLSSITYKFINLHHGFIGCIDGLKSKYYKPKDFIRFLNELKNEIEHDLYQCSKFENYCSFGYKDLDEAILSLINENIENIIKEMNEKSKKKYLKTANRIIKKYS